MHGVLFTLVLFGAGGEEQVGQPIPGAVCGDFGAPCQSCGPHGHGHALKAYRPHGRYYRDLHVQDGIHTGMPQTCYDPRYGCYAGSRMMHRYPAFHGYYYRRPYNYRHLFEYPWHAELHEPTSLFSYNVEDRMERSASPAILDDSAPTLPPPAAAADTEAPTVQRAFLRQASHNEPVVRESSQRSQLLQPRTSQSTNGVRLRR